MVGLAEKLHQDLATVPAGPAASTADPADHMYNTRWIQEQTAVRIFLRRGGPERLRER